MSDRSRSVTPTLSRHEMLRTAARGAGVAVGGAAIAFVPADLDLNDYRWVLAELLEKRCQASSVGTIFPGVGSERLCVANVKP